MNFKAAPQYGFTLIEIIIVITIMVVLAGSAIVNVTSFNQNQGVSDDIKAVLTEVRSAYTKATSSFYPYGCTGLTGYTVAVSATAKDITVTPNCSPAVGSSVKSGVLKTSKFSASQSFVISTPGGGITPSPVNISIVSDSNGSLTQTLRISSFGVFEIL